MIITVAKGSRIPQAQAAFTEHPRLYLRLLSAVSRMGSPPSPEGTSVITGHVPWIVRTLTAVTCWAIQFGGFPQRSRILATPTQQAWYCEPVALPSRSCWVGLTTRTLLLNTCFVKSRLGND